MRPLNLIRVAAVSLAAIGAAQQGGCDRPGVVLARPDAVDAGPVLVGTDGEARVGIEASGGPVEFLGPGTMDGGDARNFMPLFVPRGRLARGKTESFYIRFRPERAGPHQSTFMFPMLSGTAPPLPVVGRGVWAINAGDLALTGTIPNGGYDFGAVCLRQSKEWRMVVTNRGQTERKLVANVSFGAFEFRVDPFQPQTVAAGRQVTFTVRYTPSAVATHSAGVTAREFGGTDLHRAGVVVKGRGINC